MNAVKNICLLSTYFSVLVSYQHAARSVRAAIHHVAESLPSATEKRKRSSCFQLFIQSAWVSTNLTRSPSLIQFLCLPLSISHCSGLVPVSTALSCPCSTRHTAQLRTAEADSGVRAREKRGGLGGRQGENEHRKLRRKQ